VDPVIGVKDVPGVLREIGITPGRKYRPEDLTKLITQAKADKLRIRGYVLRMDAEGWVEIVHWSKADDFQSTMRDDWKRYRKDPGRPEMLRAGGFDGSKDPGGPPVDAGTIAPVKKRTPQQRLDSLMQRFVDDCLRTGTVPGLQDPMISTILGMAWMSGKNQITASHVRTVAAWFLERAEREKERANRKLIVRPPHGS
jgi:hypothetical protein